jgi:hypothetical protein
MEWEDFPYDIVRYALRLMRARDAGATLPDPPPPPDPFAVADPDALTGRYRDNASGSTVELAADGGGLTAEVDGDRGPLQRVAADRFLVPLPGFERFVLKVVRREERAVALVHGPRRFVRAGEPEDARSSDPSLAPFEGHYRSPSPWLTNFRVVQRNGELVWILPGGWEEPLAPLGEGTFRIGAEEWSPERIRFDAVVDGQALRANRSGCDFYRAFTP